MNENKEIDRIIGSMGRIAVVGLSPDPGRTSYAVAAYLHAQGLEIIPVNPHLTGPLFGHEPCPDLASVPGLLDVVDVFRRPEAVLPIARQAVARGGIACFWMQQGITNAQAAALLEAHGVTVIQDRCLKVEHRQRRRIVG